ncbi:MAG: glycosyltransferase family 2 protein [Porphyromonas sp.]|nr:glycosyltransferase family 2 protein [Porphyromonas sp.]
MEPTNDYKIAAVTMARNDTFFLRRWVRYYGEALGYSSLYIYLDGMDQEIPDETPSEVNITHIEHKVLTRAAGDKYRIGLLTKLAHRLLRDGYDMVLGTDADEFLVPDPITGLSLSEYLRLHAPTSHASALGLDLGQKRGVEPPLDPKRSILSQRRYALLTARYTKASIITQPVIWGSGFHRVRGRNFHILPQLYLIHTGYSDYDMVRRRFMSGSMSRHAGWRRHLARRTKTITYTTKKSAIPADQILDRARRIQTFIRPIYAPNKPMMPGCPRVVELPDRFRDIYI